MPNDIRSWSSDYLVSHLGPLLTRLECPLRHWDTVVIWFRRSSENWRASSQQEFIDTATVRVEQEVRRIVSGEIKTNFDELTKAITIGVNCRIPHRMKSRQPDIAEDARQEAVVTLLEKGLADGRSANVAGQSAARDAARRNLKLFPVSQMQLAEDEDGQSIPPWERSIDRESRDFDEAVWRLLGEATDIRRKEVLLSFADENPSDFEFLISYLARKGYRKRPTTQRDRDRASGIIKRLRRREAKSDA
jgi:hypothetical protein